MKGRITMTEVTQYKAFDGTLFDDMYKCLEYENEKKKESAGYLVMLNSQGVKVDSPAIATYVAMDIRSIDYFNRLCNADGCPTIKTSDVLKLFNSETEILCFYFDDSFDSCDGEWKCLDVLEKFVDKAFILLKQYMPQYVAVM